LRTLEVFFAAPALCTYIYA